MLVPDSKCVEFEAAHKHGRELVRYELVGEEIRCEYCGAVWRRVNEPFMVEQA